MFTNSKPGGGHLDNLNKNKGFTLIELLAVIVILAIIALITVPIVLNMIRTAKKNSAKSSAYGYIDAVNYNNDLASMNEDYNLDYTLYTEGSFHVSELNIKQKGKKPDSGIVVIENKKVVDATLCIEGYSVVYDGKEVEVKGTCNSSDEVIYKETKLHGADPELKSDMIPVTIDNDGTVKKADITKAWYSYGSKKWANAVVLTDNTSYNAGAEIPENKIKAYYVWIPRYRYEIFNDGTSGVSAQSINIVFENKNASKSTGTSNGSFLTHPAFTYGSEELNGIWVGKFETSVVSTDDCYTTNYANAITNCNKELANPRIKPDVKSLRYQQVANQYKTSKNVSIGSVMMKNDEWGAMAYLSHSKYGKNSKIERNNNSNYITGYGAVHEATTGYVSTSTSANEYGTDSSITKPWNTTVGYKASTTGNIYGIYDTSGGSYEYVMGVRTDSSGNPYSGKNVSANSGFNGAFGAPGEGEDTSLTDGIALPNSKDYTVYSYSGTNYANACSGSRCYGDATIETRYWYSNNNGFVTLAAPWIIRGGAFNNGTSAGVFYVDYYSYGGNSNGAASFRTVVR